MAYDRWGMVLVLPPLTGMPDTEVRSIMARAPKRRTLEDRFDDLMLEPAISKAIADEGARLELCRLTRSGWIRDTPKEHNP